ncbi:hypothetical protein PpBr36_03068 [Pyricularia pennisetigena]|uniref:hypothetical protein n=1 Tax=Pyricularia pennisetigena TaxID=1578925 RepID=UPI001151E582|nr:hypothetical protein PpBr36_03068 [Pyricularia pennisetigena]TLS30993.1 hypothetical protein PpBr36_03068 [Pyricularia pennisetigena]
MPNLVALPQVREKATLGPVTPLCHSVQKTPVLRHSYAEYGLGKSIVPSGLKRSRSRSVCVLDVQLWMSESMLIGCLSDVVTT